MNDRMDDLARVAEGTEEALFVEPLCAVAPIRLKEPLAETLGAFRQDGGVLVYSYLDVVKMAGHACPTTAAAFECCRLALGRLYPDEVPVRGALEVRVYGRSDDGVYGVIGQVFSFLTGAAPSSGFKGLGTFFRRKDLLTYDLAEPDASAMCFSFRRVDNGKAVLCRLFPAKMPSLAPQKAERLVALMEKVLWDAAKKHERTEFQNLWLEKVELIFRNANKPDKWLQIEEVK